MVTLSDHSFTSQAAPSAQDMRPYQRDCLTAIQSSWARGETPLAALATGAGKTSIIAQLLVETVDPVQQRALVIGHTTEIIYQLYERIKNQYGVSLKPLYGPTFAPGIGIVMAERDAQDARIVVATRQSVHPSRLKRILQYGAFDTLIVDECHHAIVESQYWHILQTLRAANPALRVLGVTATPKRTDRKALGTIFTHICYTWTILDGIQQGYLAPATRLRVKTPVDASDIHSVQGDYERKRLVSVLDASNWIDLAVKAYQDYIAPKARPTLAFFPEVAMSQAFVGRMRGAGIPAAHIDANTPKDTRAQALRDYSAGNLKIISNMAVLTEGADLPATSAILMARPTRSDTLLTQIIGRGLRLYPGKADCLIVDLTVADTKALETGTLLGKIRTCTECGAEFFLGFKTCPHCGASVPISERKAREEEGDLFDMSVPRIRRGKGYGDELVDEVVSLFSSLSAAWHRGADGYASCGAGFDAGALVIAPPTYADGGRLRDRLQHGLALLRSIDSVLRDTLIEQIGMLERMLERTDRYSLYRVSGDNQVTYLRSNSDLASLMIEADRELYKAADSRKQVERSATWRLADATPAQRNLLYLLGERNLPTTLTKGEAAERITHHKNVRCVEAWIREEDTLPEPGAA